MITFGCYGKVKCEKMLEQKKISWKVMQNLA